VAGVERIVITILAGTPSGTVRSMLGGRGRIVRAMPNLPAGIRQGVTAVSRGAGAIEGDLRPAMELFGALGPLVVEIDESLMDAFTAIAGSGPAYVFYLAQAMAEAATKMGIDADVAGRIVAQTIAGAAAMLVDAHADPAELRVSVTSKGGTTEAAIGVLTERGAMGALVEAILAARDRGRKLSGLG
jgi:pyrroline-5-carboxylate reductase